MRLRFAFVAAVLTLAAVAAAQTPDLEPDQPVHNPPLPTITYKFNFPGSIPSNYAISIESTGRAAYRSNAPEDESAAYATPGQPQKGEPYIERFTISQPTADHIFDLAGKVNYFNGDFDYKKTRVANTGAKTLIYADPTRHFETTYNWSQTPEIMALTKVFQNLSNTLEFQRRLEHDLRYQKLDLDSQLKSLLDSANHGDVAELQLLTPLLQKIMADSSVMHIARNRAKQLLSLANPETP